MAEFKVAGMLPFDRDIFYDADFATAFTTDRPMALSVSPTNPFRGVLIVVVGIFDPAFPPSGSAGGTTGSADVCTAYCEGGIEIVTVPQPYHHYVSPHYFCDHISRYMYVAILQ